jgi:DNA ligase (NAD+)
LEDVTLDEREVNVWCRNPLCPGKTEFRIIHYLKTLEIKDVGPATVRAMLVNDIIRDVPDLYNIDFEKLSSLEGFGSRSARKTIKSIYDKKDIELANFLDSLGIEGLGTSTSKLIANEFMTLKNVLRVGPEKLITLEGIGEKTAASICSGLAYFGGTIDSLLEAGVKVKDVEKIEGSLTGKSFCITGKLSMGRKEMAAKIESAGGIVKSSVSKGLDYLVAGDDVGKGKTDKAEKYGTQIISEDDLFDMM